VATDDEIRAMSGVAIGSPVTDSLVADVTARLRATHRFREIDVRKRLRSIADPSQVVLVIIVDEGPVSIDSIKGDDGATKIVRKRAFGLMFLPILTFEDGYGFTYGARFSKPDIAGANSRLSFPLSWGGQKQAAIEFEKYLDRGPFTRIEAKGALVRRTNPFYEQDDDRARATFRGERRFNQALVAGADVGVQHVSFLGHDDVVTSAGGDIVVDTRLDPMLARNAVYARAGWSYVATGDYGSLNRTDLEARGYVGLPGQAVFVVRALRTDANNPQPPYLQPMIGGSASVRGFPLGTEVGDTLVAGTAEVRMPLTSPLSVARFGVSGFFDAGAIYFKDERLQDQPAYRGFGGSVWVTASVLRLSLAVAHGVGGGTRVHFGLTTDF
jgi:outer membrane protein assembly factor BamA